MKRFIVTGLYAALCLCSALADNIITRSADTIECTVTHIDDNKVTYRRPGENFDRQLNLSDVFKIKYDNGTEDIFAKSAATPADTPPAQAASAIDLVDTEPDWDSMKPASKVYRIGDWYSENGVEGIVIWTTPDGLHGRIINTQVLNSKTFKRPKPIFTGPVDVALGMNDRSNGYANWCSLKKFMAENQQFTPEMFPLYQLVNDLGEGWYVPSIKELAYYNQLRETQVAYSGMHIKFNGKTVKWGKIFNHVSKSHKGQSLDKFITLSSTEFYSPGGASRTFSVLYGDPDEAQYVLTKYQTDSEDPFKATVRNIGYYPNYAFHLF